MTPPATLMNTREKQGEKQTKALPPKLVLNVRGGGGKEMNGFNQSLFVGIYNREKQGEKQTKALPPKLVLNVRVGGRK